MRKFISVLLALMLVFSLTTVAFNAYNVVDADAPTLQEALEADGYDGPMARVYFQMPTGSSGPIADEDVYVHVPAKLDPETGEEIESAHDDLVIEEGGKAPSWYNDYNVAEDGNHYAGYYTWGAPASPASWPGFRMEIDDYEDSIFYVDIPGDDETVIAIFNNGVDGGTDSTLPIYRMAAQTVDTNMEGAMEGDYDTLWGDTYNDFDFDGCIYVIDPNQVSINDFSGQQTCGGNWYFYYGNGCYGNYRTDADEFTSAEECCVNPDHHHGDEPEPTDAPAPTEPAPTEPAPTEPAPEPTDEPTPEPTDEPTPEPEAKVYVVGNFTDWQVNDAYQMTLNEAADTDEYTLNVNLATDSEFKCVIVTDDGQAWCPDGMGNNYGQNGEITEDGNYDVYFRPNNDGGEDWFYNCIYVAKTDVEVPTDEPTPTFEQGYYVTGSVANWGLNAEFLMTDEGDGLYSYGPISLTTEDMIKVISPNKKGTGIGNWYPDGMDNNRVVAEDGEYMIYFRPAGDGTAEDGWEYIPYVGDDSGEDAHGCTNGGYMFKFVSTDEPAPTEPAPEPTDEPTPEPTDEPATPEYMYYIVGSFTDWSPKEEYAFTETTDADTEEYVYYGLELDTDSQFKVVAVDQATGEQIWNPDGMGNNYGENGEITADGTYNVYYRPNYDGGDDWFYSCIYVEFNAPAETTAADETDAPPTWAQGYYVTGTVANWGLQEGMMMTDEGDGLYSYGPISLTTNDMIKVITPNKKGTGIGSWYPDGMDNNRTVPADGEYMIYFRPAGDGTAEDGWEYIPYVGDDSGEDAHGCTNGGYMFKFVSTDEPAPTEPAPEPTDEPTPEPTDEPEPTPEPKAYVVGNFTNWTVDDAYQMAPNDQVEDYEFCLNLDLDADAQFKCVVVMEGEQFWFPEGMGNNYGENGELPGAGNYNIYFRPNYDGGDDWFYNCIYVASTEPEPTDEPTPEPTDEPTPEPQVGKFYVVGNFTSWAVDEAYVMTLNDAAETEEYIYNTNLTTESQFKVVYVDPETGEQTWIPDGMGNNYGENGEITEDGNYDIYFRPNYDGGDDWFYNCIYVSKTEAPAPTDAPDATEPATFEQGYYVTGTVANWGLNAEFLMTDEGDGLYSYGPISLTTEDMIKVISPNKKGTGIGNWYPDGMDNNRVVAEDGEYMIYFRPAGDGTAEDGWEYIPYVGDDSGEDAHGCTNGGYMFKFVLQGETGGILGDVDGDGYVSSNDATLIQRFDAHFPVPEYFNEELGDVNGDGYTDILDVTLIQRYLAGMTVKFPIDQPVAAA